jgi:hypothetical protein
MQLYPQMLSKVFTGPSIFPVQYTVLVGVAVKVVVIVAVSVSDGVPVAVSVSVTVKVAEKVLLTVLDGLAVHVFVIVHELVAVEVPKPGADGGFLAQAWNPEANRMAISKTDIFFMKPPCFKLNYYIRREKGGQHKGLQFRCRRKTLFISGRASWPKKNQGFTASSVIVSC